MGAAAAMLAAALAPAAVLSLTLCESPAFRLRRGRRLRPEGTVPAIDRHPDTGKVKRLIPTASTRSG